MTTAQEPPTALNLDLTRAFELIHQGGQDAVSLLMIVDILETEPSYSAAVHRIAKVLQATCGPAGIAARTP